MRTLFFQIFFLKEHLMKNNYCKRLNFREDLIFAKIRSRLRFAKNRSRLRFAKNRSREKFGQCVNTTEATFNL
ncbi:MAG: hypothetical protein PV344_03235 [Anaplasma sp.]|nr:hypothetical protein [Anaplasma sp.]